MKLRVRALGFALGILFGLIFFAAILYSASYGTGVTYAQFKPIMGLWLSRSFWGALAGFLWGFIYGFVAGALVAWLYNLFHKILYKSVAAS